MAPASSPVCAAIQAGYERLSAQQRRAADYLLANHRLAFALSVHELAGAAEVSQATLVRFAREIGYAGYQELRAALMAEAKQGQGLAPEDRFAFEPPSGTAVETVGKVAEKPAWWSPDWSAVPASRARKRPSSTERLVSPRRR